jgi:hypothetical protein
MTGLDHGVGHPQLPLGWAKAPKNYRDRVFEDSSHHSERSKVADTVINAGF